MPIININDHKGLFELSSSPIISIKEARKVLGKDVRSLSDKEVEQVINSFSRLANGLIMKAAVPNTNEV